MPHLPSELLRSLWHVPPQAKTCKQGPPASETLHKRAITCKLGIALELLRLALPKRDMTDSIR